MLMVHLGAVYITVHARVRIPTYWRMLEISFSLDHWFLKSGSYTSSGGRTWELGNADSQASPQTHRIEAGGWGPATYVQEGLQVRLVLTDLAG